MSGTPHAGAASAEASESALIILIPEADALVDKHRAHLDLAASWGVMAHVTVLYPFAPPDELTDDALDRLDAVLAPFSAFDCRFERTGWFGESVLWLAPEPAEPFRALTDAVWRAFPAYPPYRGVHGSHTPHLTVAGPLENQLRAMRRVEDEVRPGLPITAKVTTVSLLVGYPRPDSWGLVRQFELDSARV